jgi:alpha-1,3-fucosyltransferase
MIPICLCTNYSCFQVDIYGACGNFRCDRKNETACWEKIEKEYYFYLSFENSICKDYVTEKFFNAMERKIIPIVLGGTDYHNSAGAPIHSHINAWEDFKNPADLAKYLKTLIDDSEKYAEFFWWRQFYKPVSDETTRRNIGYCDLCKKLHDNEQTKTYNDLEDWWIAESNCRRYTNS